MIIIAIFKLRSFLKTIYPYIELRNSQFYLHVAVLIVSCFFTFFCQYFVLSGVNLSPPVLFISYSGYYFTDFLLNLFVAYLINSFSRSVSNEAFKKNFVQILSLMKDN